MPTHYIYVSGLGDSYDGFRRLITRLWALRSGVTAELVPMLWSTDETYDDKRARLETAIAAAPADVHVVLVGESAGGCIAWVSGVHDSRVSRIVTICGKNRGATNVNPKYYQHNPALRDALHAADAVLDSERIPAHKIRTIYSSMDRLIRRNDTVLPDSDIVRISIPGHLFSIAIIGLFRFGLVQTRR